MDTLATNEAWVSLQKELGPDFQGWFLHSHEENGYYLDIFRFWLETFDSHIELTPENLHYGIFHHCLDKEAFELAQGRIDINSIKTISLYAEHAPTYQRFGKVGDDESRSLQRLTVQEEIQELPRYLDILKQVIYGQLEAEEAELLTGGVLSAKIL